MHGYGTCRSALAGAREGFDVALVDLRVPGGPAGEAMRRLAEKYPGLPMLVVTAYHDAPPLPHVAFFSKPFDTAALLDAVDRQHEARQHQLRLQTKA